MTFIVKKKIHGNEYYYLNENKRIEGKVKTKTIAYLGKTKKDAEKKAKEIIKKMSDEKMKNIIKGKKEEKKIKKEKIDETKSSKKFKENKKVIQKQISIEDLAVFCKRKGFVFKSSDIYGGLAGFWDFGPLGVELFNNIKKDWWDFFVRKRDNILGIEASIISHPRTWKASGHIESFNDLMIYCNKHKKSLRVDHLIEEVLKINVEGLEENKILNILKKNKKIFERKGYFLAGEVKPFSLMFKTNVGAMEEKDSVSYLRGETAQAMFMNFKLIQQTSRQQLPFGIAQIGRCFRNEIAPRDFLFRSREFHIGEFEFFINPDEKKCDLLKKEHLNLKFRFLDQETQKKGKKDLLKVTIKDIMKEGKLGEWHAYWLAEQIKWFRNLGLDEIKIREHTKDELSHYSSATFDIDYEYGFGSKEVAGIANRGQFDLTQHQNESKERMEVFDEGVGKKIIPRVIEPTFGMERVFLAVLTKAHNYDEKRDNVVLKLPPRLAPIKAAVFPIIKKPEFEKIAEEVVKDLKEEWNVVYDKSGSIGRRYARNDEIGTLMCITIDEKTPKDKTVTIRWRDNTEQIRIKIKDLREVMRKVIEGENIFSFGKLVDTRKKV